MLKRTASSDLYQLFRNCSLAVLNSGSLTDNSKELLSRFERISISTLLSRERGVKLEVINPPEEAFVDGRIFVPLQANLFAVLRVTSCLLTGGCTTQAVSSISTRKARSISPTSCSLLRNARALHVGETPNMVVCWGGHSIQRNQNTSTRAGSVPNSVCVS